MADKSKGPTAKPGAAPAVKKDAGTTGGDKKPAPAAVPSTPKGSGAPGAPAAAKQRMEQLLQLWQDFVQAEKAHNDRVNDIEKRLTMAEKAVDHFGKFCGDYHLLWKVKDFRRLYEEAASETRTVVYSPVFDTHRNGYKLQLSICPNGDGKGKGQAMSVFFALVKGPNDAMLKWPFMCPVTISLLEQLADRHGDTSPRDIVKTFVPNPRPENEPFLGRPAEGRNMSLGFPKFIALTEMFDGEYIKEDSIYLKVQVDISSIASV